MILVFPLNSYIVKPYSCRGINQTECLFNYRLSRARRVVENAFGILSIEFRLLRAPIALQTASVHCIVLAAIVCITSCVMTDCDTQYG